MSPETAKLVEFAVQCAVGQVGLLLVNSRSIRRRVAKLTRDLKAQSERQAQTDARVARSEEAISAVVGRVVRGETEATRRWAYLRGALDYCAAALRRPSHERS